MMTGARGGYRPKAGRPTLYAEKMFRITISLPVDHLILLSNLNSNQALAVRDILDNPDVRKIIDQHIIERKKNAAESIRSTRE